MTLGISISAATSSLQSIAAAGDALTRVQNRLSTGSKLNSARDDGAAFVIATRIKSNLVEKSVRHQSQLRTGALLDVTQSAVTSVSDILIQMKEKALAATDTSLGTVERQALRNDLTELSKQIDQVVTNGTFNGINLLKIADVPATNIPTSSAFQTSGSGSTTVGKGSGRMDLALDLAKVTASNVSIDWGDGTSYNANDTFGTPYTSANVISHVYDEAAGSRSMTYNITATTSGVSTPISPKGFRILWQTFTPDPEKTRAPIFSDGTPLSITHRPLSASALNIDDLDSLTPSQALAAVDNALQVSTGVATYYAGKQSTVERAMQLTQNMSDAYERGYGDLVDADMAKESANLLAQQTKLALSQQSLAMANQTPKLLLNLFHQ